MAEFEGQGPAPGTLIAPSGEELTGRRLQLAVGGMTCSSCAARVEKKLNRLDGVRASVNYATGKATLEVAGTVHEDYLTRAVAAIGYSATPVGAEAAVMIDPDVAETRKLWQRLMVALVLFVPLSDLRCCSRCSRPPGSPVGNWS